MMFLHLLLVGCKFSTETTTGYLSNHSEKTRLLLADFENCVVNEKSEQDINNVAEYVSKFGLKTIPNDWRERFCSAQKNQKFEYTIQTVGIEGTPLIIKQIDFTNDGDALVPHILVVGGNERPEFDISPAELKQDYMQFDKWTGSCVPFLFDVESEESWVLSLKNGKLNEVNYYIATLCRNEKFRFRY